MRSILLFVYFSILTLIFIFIQGLQFAVSFSLDLHVHLSCMREKIKSDADHINPCYPIDLVPYNYPGHYIPIPGYGLCLLSCSKKEGVGF